MSVALLLHRIAEDRAEARVGDTLLATFEPSALLVDQPLFSTRPLPADPVAYGRRLWAALGGEALHSALADLPLAPNLDSLVAIRSADPELHAIPWEYLHDGADFLIFRTLLVREVPGAPLPAPPDPSQPWRLVAMGSDPLLQEVRDPETNTLQDYVPLRRLQVVRELDTLRDALQRRNPPVPVRWQRIAPTAQALIDDLDPREPAWFHYTGHGDVVDGRPILCFDDGTGCMAPRPVADLAADLREVVQFAFLNACRTADSREPGANLALTLVRNGIPAVLGTQYQVLDAAANIFAQTFYRSLAAGQHPARALYQARRQLRTQFSSEPREWAVPALYLAQGYRWQAQQPSLVAPLDSIEPPLPRTEALRTPATIVGRDREMMELARNFLVDNQRIVTIRGPGGIGKTALVNALAERLRFHFVDGIYALTLALPAGDERLVAATVRRSLADVLGVQHPAFDDPAAAAAQAEVLAGVARRRPRMLLIWDNYETVLWRLGRDRDDDDAPSPVAAEQREEAAAVQRLVHSLADAGAALLFTSRQSPVGLPGEAFYPSVAQGFQLGGLDPVSSEQLLRANVGLRIPSRGFLAQIAEAVGYSPLALRLAAARWANSQDDEADFLRNLADELLKAEDAGLSPHQVSVSVNVRLSVDALPPGRRDDLLALAIVANSLITPMHGAVVWGLEDDDRWFADQAHARLELLSQASLLQGLGYDSARNRSEIYAMQSVIAGVIGRMAQEPHQAAGQAAARDRYARWADMMVSRAYGEGGIDFDPEIAQATRSILPDLPAALADLPDDRRGWAAWRAATILRQFGQPGQAEQMLDMAETTVRQAENTELLSRIHHEQAVVLETRGELDGAMRLYEQSLAIQESLGEVRGKSATLANMSIIQFRQGDRETALHNARESLRLLRAMGAADAAKVAEIVQQMEAASSDQKTTESAELSPARLAGALTAATVRALRGQLPRAGVQAELQGLSAAGDLEPVRAALLAALAGTPSAAAELLAAAAPLLAQGAPAERADALVGIGNLADSLGDGATKLRAREAAADAFRRAGTDREALVQLSIALYNLALTYANQGDPSAAVPLLEEVVALDERTGHPDLESDRAALEQMRRRATGTREPGLREAMAAWVDQGRDEEQFTGLLNAACNLYIQAMRADDLEQRAALAHDLAYMRAARPLPIAGANDFLAVLQLLLRGEPAMRERAARQRAALPAPLAQALDTMERAIAGEPSPPPAEREAVETAAAQALLGQLTPEQQAELAVAAQVMPFLQTAIQILRQPQIAVTERARHAEGLEQAAEQAAADESAGSPWLAAAAALRVAAGWLRGAPPDLTDLPEPYRSLIDALMKEPSDD